MNNIEKTLNSKRKRQVEIEKEAKTLDMEIKALETAIRIMRGKRRGRKSSAVKSVATTAKVAVKSPAKVVGSNMADDNPSGIYKDYTAPKAVRHLLKTKKLKASASQITKLILENGWRTKSSKPANSIYITLARMASNKTIKRAKKGKQTVFYS